VPLSLPYCHGLVGVILLSLTTRLLQDSLDMEDAQYMRQQGVGQPQFSAAEELRRSMFAHTSPEAEFGGRRDGRGRYRGGWSAGRGRMSREYK